MHQSIYSITPLPRLLCALGAMTMIGCHGPQSTLQPAGNGAQAIATLFWCMLSGGLVIYLCMIGLALYSVRVPAKAVSQRRTRLLVIGGGTVIPTTLLSVLLLSSLPLLPDLLAPAPQGALNIQVQGKMWWWRVRYLGPEDETVELANEIRLPVGQPVEFQLTSGDVIHSFWIPSLGGKVDMFPGRVTRLKLEPTRTGVFRGVCAEYCGASHALMGFDVVVMEKDEFARWLDDQRKPAVAPTGSRATGGAQQFMHTGCHACHTIRGSAARGRVGPDLTHFGSRLTGAAGALENETDRLIEWISHPGEIKPGAKMPGFGMLSDDELATLAAYLKELR